MMPWEDPFFAVAQGLASSPDAAAEADLGNYVVELRIVCRGQRPTGGD